MGEETDDRDAVRERDYLIRDMLRRIDAIEAHISRMQDNVTRMDVMIEQGVTGGAAAHFAELAKLIDGLRSDINQLQTKTNKWEGGGIALYSTLAAAFGTIGWFLSHLFGGNR